MTYDDFQAVILLGGLGTRLQEMHPDLPKALVPIEGRPFLDWQLAWLSQRGVSSVVLAAGYRADQIESHVSSAWAGQMKIAVSRESSPLGTGGAIRHCRPHLGPGTILVVNGDTLLPELDLSRFLRKHRQCEASASIAAVPMKDSERYGTIETDSRGTVLCFHEKACVEEGLVNGGHYLLEEDILGRLPDGRAISLEREFFPKLIQGRKICAIEFAPPLLDMGTPDGVLAMEKFLRRSRCAGWF